MIKIGKKGTSVFVVGMSVSGGSVSWEGSPWQHIPLFVLF